MEQINQIFGENITNLRTEHHMTQLELGEKLNYSDKAVSRWERGEAIPDARVLLQLSDMFGVTIDDLLKKPSVTSKKTVHQRLANHHLITLISIVGVWTLALLIYVIMYLCGISQWLVFVYTLPISLIVALVFASLWGGRKSVFIIISALIWSIISCIYLTALSFNWWILFLLGVPAQIIVYLGFRIHKKH